MNVPEMIVMIVAISAVASILRAKYGVVRRNRHVEEVFVGKQIANADAERMREEIKTLKERIAVLERLATDTSNAVQLDREIEKLR